jgi:uncharacterized protein (DUF2147 family)
MSGKRCRGGLAALAAVIALAAPGFAAPAWAADPTGTWLTEGGKSRVRVARCGDALCGTVVWLKDPNDHETGQPLTDKRNSDADKRSRPLVGLAIISGMKPAGTPDKWEGEIYNPEDGKTYGATFQMLDPRTAELKGCVLGGLICGRQTWSRAN